MASSKNNGIIGSIKINDQTTISLNLDLDWLVLAAKMAKADAEDATKVVTTKTQMTDITKADGTKVELSKYKNITGDAVDTFITLLDTILTPDNTEGIANLIKALIPADLDPQIASVVYDVLNNPDAIKQIIGVLVRVLSGDYTVNDNNPFDYAVLAVLEYAYEHFTGGKDSVTTAIDKLDKIVSRAVPQVVKVLGNASKGVLAVFVLCKTFFNISPCCAAAEECSNCRIPAIRARQLQTKQSRTSLTMYSLSSTTSATLRSQRF